MSEPEFLSSSDLQELTGYKQAELREKWLAEQGIPYRRVGQRVIVARFHARAWLEGRHVVASNEPNLGALRA